MKSARLCFTLLVALLFSIFTGAILVQRSRATSSVRADIQTSAIEKREEAYRANNLGVALLEQYKPKEASAEFTRALQIKPDLLLARINLSIALYYLPDADGARREAEKALAQDANAPQPRYILGLIARAQNRFDDAVAQFQRVLKVDADDVATNINVGQIYVQQKKYPEAITAFRAAIAAEPYNQTALYNLGILLTRTGAKEEGQRLIQKFQQLRQTGAGTTIGTNYLEGGRYAEAVVSTGAEADLVDRSVPNVTFVDATPAFLPGKVTAPDRAWTKSTFSRFGSMKAADFNDARKEELIRSFAGGVTLFDLDGDGDLDLLDLGPAGPRLYRNDGGKFSDITAQCGSLCEAKEGISIGAVAGDYDNDGRPDLLVLSYGPQTLSLYHNDGEGRFSDVTRKAGIPSYPFLTISAAFVDVDHDGDLDILVGGLADLSRPPVPRKDIGGPKGIISFPLSFAGAPNLLLRNNGNGSFTDITALAKLAGPPGHATAVLATDYDNRRDIDLLIVNFGSPPALYRNMRDGTFRDVAHETGLDVEGKRRIRSGNWDFIAVAAGDYNKDGFTDLFFLDSGSSGVFATSDGKGKFTLEDKTPWLFQVGGSGNNAVQLLDYDNDGLLDLVWLMGDGLHVWRNLGNEWQKISSPNQGPIGINAAPLWKARTGVSRTLASGDLDGDGDIDIVVRSAEGRLIIARNEGGNHNHSLRVELAGRVSNRSGTGAKVELRAGSLWQKLETYSTTPAPAPADLTFGLGRREVADALRVLWPAGIVQAETENLPGRSTQSAARAGTFMPPLRITELDRKPSSCPYLYTWNGERFEFVTDFMGGGEMGYLEEPGHYNKPDPVEYVRISDDQLKERNGRFELRVTNELEEALFVDRLQLFAVAHPKDTEVYPNEGMSNPPKPYKLYITRKARPPLAAVDDHGQAVLDRIAKLDRRYPDNFTVDRIRGYGAEHTLTMELEEPKYKVQSPRSKVRPTNLGVTKQTLGVGPWTWDEREIVSSERVVLLLSGWTDYAWSSDNVAASQAGKTMRLPFLQVKDKAGQWRTVIEDIGIPVGRPQTVTVDLTGKFLSANRDVRIVTNMRIYWDQILVDTSEGDSPTQITKLDPTRAILCWRGFSQEVSADGREPFGYDYAHVSFTSPWKVMTGRYTREGDVRELLLRSDDMFVISQPGDEISLSFDATALPPLPASWKRTFLLYADGFSKEMDINSASPDQIAPMPFHGMSKYPYSWPEHYPITEKHSSYIEKYNTRMVTSPVPSIDSEFVRR